MSLQEVLKQELINRMGFKKDDWKLAMTEPVSQSVGNIDNPTEVAQEIVNKVISNFPPEITHRGVEAIYFFFDSFGYDYMKNKLMEAINELPPILNEVMLLRAEGLIFSEISKKLNISEAAARSRSSRATKQLREILEK